MKGILFNVVQQVVETQFGADAWDDAIDRSDVDGSYTSLGNYPDSDLDRLVGSLGEPIEMSRNEVLAFLGRHGFGHLAARHADLLVDFPGWRDVVGHLDDLIHPEVEKIYADATPPSFTVFDQDDGSLRMVYESGRQLCSLAEGLLLGLGDWFDCPLSVSHLECVRNGDPTCTLVVVEQ